MNVEQLTLTAMENGVQYAWLRRILNDYEMANILFASSKWNGACYHLQQAVEKLLKYIISDAGHPIRHTHSVHELAKECNKRLEMDIFDNEIIDAYKELSQYNTIARYPSSCDAPVYIITKRQALSALDTFNNTLIILGQL